MENLLGMLVPVGTLMLIFLVQISFWFPTAENKQQKQKHTAAASNTKTEDRPQIQGSSKALDSRPLNGGSVVSKRITITAQDLPPQNGLGCIVIPESKPTTPTTLSSNGTESSDETLVRGAPKQTEKKMWKCACEFGFVPAGLLRTFGNAEAMMRLGVGQCYHKK